MLVAIDANIIVFALTGKPNLRLVARRWLDLLEAKDALLVTSALSRLECLVRPHRLGRTSELALFESFFEGVVEVPIESEVLTLPSRIRARSRGLQTPDAIHLASAQIIKADLFLTGDRRLKAYKDVAVAYALRDDPASLDR
jgi:predicted nucleic acid-binding protein